MVSREKPSCLASDSAPHVSIVVPTFNEEGNIRALYEELLRVLGADGDYEIIFVEGGSTDKTLDNIEALSESDARVKCLNLSRNFGHQCALKAGLDYATGACVISLDADLQHPPRLIPEMLDKWREGYDVVCTRRSDIQNVSPIKRITSRLFYSLFNALSDVKTEQGAADFRLLDREVVDVLGNLNESNLFLRGLIKWVGFQQCCIDYTPAVRHSGTTKYFLVKRISLALKGITSFSIRPLRLSTLLGLMTSFIAACYGVYVVAIALFTDKAISGWPSVIASVLFMGGIQLLMIGILGEYLGRLFIESKNRPNYIVRNPRRSARTEQGVPPVRSQKKTPP